MQKAHRKKIIKASLKLWDCFSLHRSSPSLVQMQRNCIRKEKLSKYKLMVFSWSKQVTLSTRYSTLILKITEIMVGADINASVEREMLSSRRSLHTTIVPIRSIKPTERQTYFIYYNRKQIQIITWDTWGFSFEDMHLYRGNNTRPLFSDQSKKLICS